MNALIAQSLAVGVVVFHMALAPVPEIGFVLQISGPGGAVGSAVALYARRRDPDADAWRIVTAWSTSMLAVALIALAVASLI